MFSTESSMDMQIHLFQKFEKTGTDLIAGIGRGDQDETQGVKGYILPALLSLCTRGLDLWESNGKT